MSIARQLSRRRFLGGLTLVGTAGLLGVRPNPTAAEPPPETTTLKLSARRRPGSTCQAPMYLMEELLWGEGFTDVQYVEAASTVEAYKALAAGDVDLGMGFAAPLILHVGAGDAIVFLAGGHVGCFEFFGSDRIRAVRDLKGKTVAVPGLGSTQHIFLASIVAYIGLDPRQDIAWVTHPPAEAMQRLAEGTIDAFLGFPPQPQELRAKRIGRVVVNSMMDRPWSHYFCCMPVGNREFVREHPIATKRWLRALLKATDVCAREPARVAQFLVDQGYAEHYEYTLQAVQEIPYDKWRAYDPEDTVRFYALRLHETGMITSTPQKIIAQGTDWRFLTELKRELKG
ncbi:MAG TPA: ABC transporter substrate-binding protein [Candidatus Tectomicrobia bacterium]